MMCSHQASINIFMVSQPVVNEILLCGIANWYCHLLSNPLPMELLEAPRGTQICQIVMSPGIAILSFDIQLVDMASSYPKRSQRQFQETLIYWVNVSRQWQSLVFCPCVLLCVLSLIDNVMWKKKTANANSYLGIKCCFINKKNNPAHSRIQETGSS